MDRFSPKEQRSYNERLNNNITKKCTYCKRDANHKFDTCCQSCGKSGGTTHTQPCNLYYDNMKVGNPF